MLEKSQHYQQTVRESVHAYYQAVRAMDAEALGAALSEDVVSFDPVGDPPIEGRQGVRRAYRARWEGLGGVGVTEDYIFVAGDGAAVKWTMQVVDATGVHVSEGIDVFEVNEQGSIQTVWSYADGAWQDPAARHTAPDHPRGGGRG